MTVLKLKKAHTAIIKHKSIGKIKTVGQGQIVNYNGVSYTQSRYRSKDEIKTYWSHIHQAHEIAGNKYEKLFNTLKEIFDKTFGDRH